MTEQQLFEFLSQLSSLLSLTLESSSGKVLSAICLHPSLTTLKSLNLQEPKLIPQELHLLSSLTKLKVSSLQAKKIPHLPPNLQRVAIESCQLDEFPKTLFELHSLHTLSLFTNNIATIPKEIRFFSSLTSLNLNYNRITELPEEITECPLQILNMSGNSLQQFPRQLLKMTKTLQQLNLQDNSELDLYWTISTEKDTKETVELITITPEKTLSTELSIRLKNKVTEEDLFSIISNLPSIQRLHLETFEKKIRWHELVLKLNSLTDLSLMKIQSIPKELSLLSSLTSLTIGYSCSNERLFESLSSLQPQTEVTVSPVLQSV